MSELSWVLSENYDYVTRGMLAVALVIFLLLLFINAPYGRHLRSGWGPSVPAKLGWILMELPAPVFMAWAYALGENSAEAFPIFFLALFQLHYLHRAVIFPLLSRGTGRKMALFTVVAAFVFNSLNGAMCGWAVSEVVTYDPSWLSDPRFIVGVVLFFSGAWINLRADSTLRALRKPGDTAYHIPEGGLYRFVSSPNYLGEIVEWFGFALATWSMAGLAFAVFTLANLVPRARANHLWYQEHFANYPKERRAILPFLY
ncbi:MAG: methyltransferase [Myxococcota bacterium]|nr:methyltransferase [Myxococcota bacterium]